MPFIESLLDTDLYKLTMQQAVWSRFPQATAEYAFQCRSKNVDLRQYADAVRAEIDALCSLRFTDAELSYLRGIRYLKPGYVDSLARFALDPAAVRITTDGDQLAIRVSGGWYQTILFEVPILAVVNEIHTRATAPPTAERLAEGEKRLRDKCEVLRRAAAAGLPLRIIEFGTRRRYGRAWQRRVLEILDAETGESLVGTSNVALARAFGLRPFGTMAHEWLQAGQAFTHVADSQKFALEQWMQEYRGDLGIALSDVFGMKAFLHDFDPLFTNAYDGARHDSGDPFAWCEALIAHYERLGIDPRTKSAVFSDSLDVGKVLALAERFEGRIRTSFGIGTNLTNDVGTEPLSIVMKMVRCNGRPVVKVSDSPGKALSEDPVYLAYVKGVWGV